VIVDLEVTEAKVLIVDMMIYSIYSSSNSQVMWLQNQKFDLLLLIFFSFCCWSQSVISLDGDKLIHVQKWDGKETNLVREIKDGKMIVVSDNSSFSVHASFSCSYPSSSSLPPFLPSLITLCHNQGCLTVCKTG
jgi:hypothetical protein